MASLEPNETHWKHHSFWNYLKLSVQLRIYCRQVLFNTRKIGKFSKRHRSTLLKYRRHARTCPHHRLPRAVGGGIRFHVHFKCFNGGFAVTLSKKELLLAVSRDNVKSLLSLSLEKLLKWSMCLRVLLSNRFSAFQQKTLTTCDSRISQGLRK